MSSNRNGLGPFTGILFKALVCAAFFAVSPLLALAAPSATELAAFLNQTDRIRLVITSAPGYGHQSAAAQTLQEIRRIGYVGWVDVVYDAEATSRLRPRLSSVLPPFDDAVRGVQVFETEKLRFIPMTKPAERSQLTLPEGSEHLPLAIAGGEDYALSPFNLKVDTVLRVNPPRWQEGIEIDHGLYRILVSNSNDISFDHQPPAVPDTLRFVDQSMGHSRRFRAKSESLKFILSQRGIDISVLYGHHMVGQHQVSTYLEGLVRAREGFESHFADKTVLFLINDFRVGARNALEHQIFRNSTLAGNIRFAEVEDSEQLKEKVNKMSKGEILVVYTGGVSKPMFEYLYSRATLPSVVEGVNSVDLVKSYGLPFLPSGASHGQPMGSLFAQLTDMEGNLSLSQVISDPAFQHLLRSNDIWDLARAAGILFAQPNFDRSHIDLIVRFLRASKVSPALGAAFKAKSTPLRSQMESRVAVALHNLQRLYDSGLVVQAMGARTFSTRDENTELSVVRKVSREKIETSMIHREGLAARACPATFKIAN